MAFPGAMLAAFSDALRVLYSAPSSTAAVLTILPALERLFQSRWVNADELPVSGQPVPYGCTNVAEVAGVLSDYPAYAHELPSVQNVRAGRWAPTYRLLDFASKRQLRHTNIYAGVMLGVGIQDQLGFAIRVPGAIGIGITCNRDRDFTDDEHYLAALMVSHLQAVTGRLRAQELAGRCPGSLATWHAAVSAHGRCRAAPLGLSEVLHRYLPDDRSTVFGDLPDGVVRWIRHTASQLGSLQAGSVAPSFWEIARPSGRLNLSLRLARPHGNELVLVASEFTELTDFGCSRRKELTMRERDVLYWITEGKRDAEIAQILGIASRTVGKHIERVLAKLGAAHRQSAAHMARERWRSGGVANE